MIKAIILLSMLFCHIVDDYYLQEILAQMKQKKWWEINAPAEKYENDYMCALIEHAFSWTFSIMFPLIIAFLLWYLKVSWIVFIIVFGINWIAHSIVDNLKANELKINLCQDQLIHFIQIILTFIIVCGLGSII